MRITQTQVNICAISEWKSLFEQLEVFVMMVILLAIYLYD